MASVERHLWGWQELLRGERPLGFETFLFGNDRLGDRVVSRVGHSQFPGFVFSITFDNDGVPVGFAVYPYVRSELSDIAGRFFSGKPDPLPTGFPPVTATLLRTIPIGQLTKAARRALSEDRMIDAPEWPAIASAANRRPPGRPGRPDLHYAHLAADYVELVSSGRPPLPDLAAQREEGRRSIRDQISEARRRKLLTKPAIRNTSGGELTPKAIALLKGTHDGQH